VHSSYNPWIKVFWENATANPSPITVGTFALVTVIALILYFKVLKGKFGELASLGFGIIFGALTIVSLLRVLHIT
jgi:hypothetical protein